MESTSPIHSPELREELRQMYAQDPEARILPQIRRRLADPMKPTNENGRFRPHPLALLLGTIGAIAAAVFLYFSYFKP